jgi:hypothetical protein
MVRLARPLRVGPYVGETLASPRAGRLAGRVLDPLRRFADPVNWGRGRHRYWRLESAVFDQRFDELFRKSTEGFRGVIGVRDSRYLNWRYSANPVYQTQMLAAERDDKLAAYALFVEEDGTAAIKDIFPMHCPDLVRDVLGELIRLGYQRGWRSIGMTLLESNPVLAVLAGLGFRPRAETSLMYAYCPADRPWAEAVLDQGQWLLTVGDRDV